MISAVHEQVDREATARNEEVVRRAQRVLAPESFEEYASTKRKLRLLAHRARIRNYGNYGHTERTHESEMYEDAAANVPRPLDWDRRLWRRALAGETEILGGALHGE